MRKITTESVQAFMNHRPFKMANMQVLQGVDGSMLLLHGNAIARLDYNTNELRISSAGGQTVTTKERLNGLPNVSITQRNFTWYLNGNEWDGEWVTVPCTGHHESIESLFDCNECEPLFS